MLSKRKLPYDRLALPPDKRLRANFENLISSNVVSGQRGAQLINDAISGSATGLGDLHTPETRSGMKNAARKFRRRMLQKGWPPLYHCKVRGWDPKSEREQLMDLAMLLPHEILHKLVHFGDSSVLLETGGLDLESFRHVQRARGLSGIPDLAALGVWQDGVPCMWDRSMSAEIISLLLPGAAGEFKNLRIPLTAFLKEHVGPNTFDDVFDVLHWSFVHLGSKRWPSSRHDGSAFNAKTDSWRQRQRAADPMLPIGGVLCQIKGDWKMMKEVLKLPGWQDEEVCFLCNIKKREAPWEAKRGARNVAPVRAMQRRRRQKTSEVRNKKSDSQKINDDKT